MMPPPPDVHKLNEEASLLEEPEDESVATGREAFALLYQELASLATEVGTQLTQPLCTDAYNTYIHLRITDASIYLHLAQYC